MKDAQYEVDKLDMIKFAVSLHTVLILNDTTFAGNAILDLIGVQERCVIN